MAEQNSPGGVKLPRVAITYCTQCKWMLRAGYFGQELLSTFGTSIGEIALIPATGGIFTVYLTYKPTASSETEHVLLWDRKAEGGFPETKILKQRVRNHIEPEKKLGHSDTPSSKEKSNSETTVKADASKDPLARDPGASNMQGPTTSEACEDCR